MNDCFTLELTQYAYKLDILAFFLFDKLESFVWGAINLTVAVVKKKRIKIKDVRKGLFFMNINPLVIIPEEQTCVTA